MVKMRCVFWTTYKCGQKFLAAPLPFYSSEHITGLAVTMLISLLVLCAQQAVYLQAIQRR